MIDDEKRGKLICELRKKKNLTQKELGDLIHYTDKNISKWERGISFPNNPNVLNKLAEILEISVEELMYGEKRETSNYEQIRKNFLNEYKNNYNKYRKNVSTLLVIMLVLIIVSLISIYIVFIRNSIKVYTISFENNNVKGINSTLVVTNKINILNFNKLVTNGKNIETIRMYFITDSDKIIEIFYGINTDYYIEEANGYAEYFLKDMLNNKVYLEVTYDDGESDLVELLLQEKYTNDNVFPKKVDNILEGETTSLGNDLEEKLINLDFVNYESYLEKKISKNVTCIYDVDTKGLLITIEKDNVIEYIANRIELDSITYEKLSDGRLVETEELNLKEQKNCILEKCSTKEDYAMFINYLKNS